MTSLNELLGLGSHAGNQVAQSRVCAYPLQDNAASTTVLDYSGHSRDGTLNTGTTAALTAAGPNLWLPASLQFTGTQYVTLPDTTEINTAGQTLLAWVKSTDSGGINRSWFGQGVNEPGRNWNFTSEGGVRWRHGNGQIGYSATPLNWNCVGIALPASATTTNDLATIRINGANVSGSRLAGANQTLTTFGETGPYIAADILLGAGGGLYLGSIAMLSRFSRALTTAEIDEYYSGPEPVNSVAPVASGTATVGETLSVTTGTWGVAAPFGPNGTIIYTYQWTASDDNIGTNEINISGATSSTFELTDSEIGKYVRCWIRATNDGGFDADADTASNFIGAVESANNGTRRRRIICGRLT